MDELQRLRHEVRADFALMEARTGELGKRMEKLASTAANAVEAAETAAEAAQRAAEAAGRAAEAAGAAGRETRLIGQECAEYYQWTQGRLRLMNERFDVILGTVSGDLEDLKRRVKRLEEQIPRAS